MNRNYGSSITASPSVNDYHPSDLVRKVDDSLGNTSEFAYLPLSSRQVNNLYSANYDDVVDKDHFHFTSSMYVVHK
uniref:hypothetical protein n=1 Tax=Glaciecola sp. SC05 TaxID=1987355 RepID=UPI003527FE64